MFFYPCQSVPSVVNLDTNFIVLVVGWVLTALLLGVVATRFERLRSWWGIGLGIMAGSLVVLGLMLFTVERVYGPPAPPKVKSTDEMMAYFATQPTKVTTQV